jgi:hypothetical protein
MVNKQKALDFPINSWVIFTKDLPEIYVEKGTTGIVDSNYYKHKFLVRVSIQKSIDWNYSYWVPKDSIELRPTYIEKVKKDIKSKCKSAHNDVEYIVSHLEEIKNSIDDESPHYMLLCDFNERFKSLIEKLQDISDKKRLVLKKES